MSSDPRHEMLRAIVKTLPTDFEPWGKRSREDDWGPDCSCGCRFFVPLEGGLRYDWGVCYNPVSPRCGLLTFEHQGCPEFETAHDDTNLEEATRPLPSDASAEEQLLRNLRVYRTEIAELLAKSNDHWGFEDPVYRFYHQSFKVYFIQSQTEAVVELLKKLYSERELHPWFREILRDGTEKGFRLEDNRDWTRCTRPLLEAFFHARFFLEMASRYATLEQPPRLLPSGYAALLYLYGLR